MKLSKKKQENTKNRNKIQQVNKQKKLPKMHLKTKKN